MVSPSPVWLAFSGPFLSGNRLKNNAQVAVVTLEPLPPVILDELAGVRLVQECMQTPGVGRYSSTAGINKRVASLYCRASGDVKSEATMDAFMATIRSFFERRGYQVVSREELLRQAPDYRLCPGRLGYAVPPTSIRGVAGRLFILRIKVADMYICLMNL